MRSDARHRQLTDHQRGALQGAAETARRHRKILLAALSPLGLLAFCGLLSPVLDSDEVTLEPIVMMFVLTMPWVLAASAGLVMISSLRARTVRIGAYCAAVPSSPGQPARCHACGAELQATSLAFARCDFCRADNFLAPDAMEQALATRSSSAGTIEASVEHHLAALRREGVGAGALAVTSVVLAPLFAFVVGVLTAVVLGHFVRRAPDELRRYAVVDTGVGRCIARVSHQDRNVLEFGNRAPAGVPRIVPRPAETKDFAVTALVHRDVLTHLGRGRVERVFRTLDSKENSVEVVLPSGQKLMPNLVLGMCVPPDVTL